jgi:DNA (cytosine-5)-methyltransferase 1
MKRAGHCTSVLCEIDTHARAVLNARFPKTQVVPDVRDMIDIPKSVNLVTAGFPCQDLSSVGQKRGIKGARSGLVEEVFRILRNNSVEWVVIENVKFMLHLKKGAAIARIVSGLEKLGYKWAYRVVNSLSFGLPHRRHRVFFVASLSHDPRNVLLSDTASPPRISSPSLDKPLGFYWTEGTYALGMAVDAIPPLKGGSSIGIPSPPAVLLPSGEVCTPDIRDSERLQGFKSGWTEPAEEVGRKSSRWRLVGNAVTVPVAEWIGRRLCNPKCYDDSMDEPINGRWPEAAWGLGGCRYASEASEWPVKTRRIGLGKFLKFTPKPLSPKATAGFLRRARAGNLRFPPGFLEALDDHLISVEKRDN